MDNPHRPPFLRALWEMILAYRPRPSVGGLRRLRILLPSPGNVLFTLLVVGGLFWAGSVGAVPLLQTAASSTNTVAYQGRLADATGNPVTATTPMVFRLYNAATGGVPLWEENWTGSNSVHVSDGLFNVMLGSLTQIPQSVVTGNSNLWLGITVNADNEMQPRVQLGTVPFAVQALTVPDGSITAAKLAPSALRIPIYSAGTTTVGWQNPTCDYTATAVPGLRVEFVANQPSILDISASGLARNTKAGAATYTQIYVDNSSVVVGTEPLVTGCRNLGDSWCSLSNLATQEVTTGTHVVEVRAVCDGGTTAISNVWNGWLTVRVFPK